ncbi:MAG TPA: hypothetical protein VFH21_08045 [Burkholderiales bacterium]|nr:hypothetical protein [Burkholderiales bacterium]
MYFSFGIPLVYLAPAGFAYLEPEGSWRWASIPFAAQAVWMLSTSSLGNLFPVGLV